MHRIKRLTGWRLAAFIFADAIPLLMILMGIVLLCTQTVFTVSVLFAFFLLPCGIVIWNFFWITSCKKVWIRWILCVIFGAVFLFLIAQLLVFGHFALIDIHEGEDVCQVYSEAIDVCPIMPGLQDLGQPETITYAYYYSQMLWYFTDDAYTLICTYTEEDYLEQKQLLDKTYSFQQDTMSQFEELCAPIVQFGDYTFRFLSVDGAYGTVFSFPKYVMLIGTNDLTREIVYLYHEDTDLDYISSSADFIETSCGWKYLR